MTNATRSKRRRENYIPVNGTLNLGKGEYKRSKEVLEIMSVSQSHEGNNGNKYPKSLIQRIRRSKSSAKLMTSLLISEGWSTMSKGYIKYLRQWPRRVWKGVE